MENAKTTNVVNCHSSISCRPNYRPLAMAAMLIFASTVVHAGEAAAAQYPPADDQLQRVETGHYAVDSKFWSPRIKHIVVSYVPYLMDIMEHDKTDWKVFGRFKGVPEKRAGENITNFFVHNWADNTVINTFEAMCASLMVDPQGDPEMIAAQKKIRAGIKRWFPVLLAAQDKDGYLCTDVQMRDAPHFISPPLDQHEGYVMGYFIEACMTHYRAFDGKDLRMYNAAKKAADLWCNTIGDPPKKAWEPDHEELEQALTRWSVLVDQVEGPGKGDKYLELAHWLLLHRGVTPPHVDHYRQKDQPIVDQAEPFGHAVMFGYLYAGAADVARLTGDKRLAAACDRIWDKLVNGKMYLTGAIGSDNEVFQESYELPNDVKLGESCANIANMFFQEDMELLHADSKYADVAELALYNGVLGGLALNEPKWEYFNPLDQSYGRHNNSPDCCMGNLPRVLLQLPTRIYAKSARSIYINQFIGSTVTVPGVAGTDLTITQETGYPWSNHIAIVVNPASPKQFAIHIRVPNRQPSRLYTDTPAINGFESISLNGAPIQPRKEKGYLVIERTWNPGDRVELSLPMKIQRVTANPRIAADVGRVALQYGPLIYNFESADLPPGKNLDDLALATNNPLKIEWDSRLLDGVMAIRGTFADGTPLQAIPNYARMNRLHPSQPWVQVIDTYDGTTQRVYVNGRLASTRQVGPLKIIDTPLTIGSDRFGQNRHFAGTIDNLEIFSQALDTNSITKLLACAPGGFDPSIEPKPVFAGGPYKLNGEEPITTPSKIGISGNAPWTISIWFKASDACQSPDSYGAGIVTWGEGDINAANFIYYRPEGEVVFGFYGDDDRTSTGPQTSDRSIVWIRDEAGVARHQNFDSPMNPGDPN
jgi:uncharacterized protein